MEKSDEQHPPPPPSGDDSRSLVLVRVEVGSGGGSLLGWVRVPVPTYPAASMGSKLVSSGDGSIENWDIVGDGSDWSVRGSVGGGWWVS